MGWKDIKSTVLMVEGLVFSGCVHTLYRAETGKLPLHEAMVCLDAVLVTAMVEVLSANISFSETMTSVSAGGTITSSRLVSI